MGILLKIALGCDHAGLKLKSFIVEKLETINPGETYVITFIADKVGILNIGVL